MPEIGLTELQQLETVHEPITRPASDQHRRHD
jgi:hypothetical protein